MAEGPLKGVRTGAGGKLGPFQGPIAQLVERMAGSHEVAGSSPAGSTREGQSALLSLDLLMSDRVDQLADEGAVVSSFGSLVRCAWPAALFAKACAGGPPFSATIGLPQLLWAAAWIWTWSPFAATALT